jgi:hypothetical protein
MRLIKLKTGERISSFKPSTLYCDTSQDMSHPRYLDLDHAKALMHLSSHKQVE